MNDQDATTKPEAPAELCSSALLCCPFCGGKGEYNVTADGGHFVDCTECQAASKLVYPDKTDPKPLVAEAWNNRSLDARWVLRKSLRIASNILRQWNCTSETKILELAKAIGNDLYEPLCGAPGEPGLTSEANAAPPLPPVLCPLCRETLQDGTQVIENVHIGKVHIACVLLRAIDDKQKHPSKT